jgi:uncharacterized protein YecE (DUF72 family)
MATAYIGTSGYVYSDWRGRFYPADLPHARWLEFYAQRLATVELNVTFYRLPAESAFRGWHERTPEAFRFAVKGSRFVTHIKRLKDVEDSLRLFLKRVRLLREKLAAILWQLPPSFRLDLDRLERFVAFLSAYRRIRHVLEVRHQSWVVPATMTLLRDARVALCETDFPACQVHGSPTADFAYIRRHGTAGLLYAGRYTKPQLSQDAKAIRANLQDGQDVFCYFNNDQHAYAATNALELIEILKRQPASPNS